MHEASDVALAPLVSVVMPAYGVERHLPSAIHAVRSQTFDDWELIVVDDASPDGSAEIARSCAARDARIRVVSHDANRGLSAARNTGIGVARGTYVWMPDPDDLYDVDLLARAVSWVGKDALPDAIVFGHVEEYYDVRGAFMYEHPLPIPEMGRLEPGRWHALVMGWERETHLGYAWNKLYRLELIRALGLTFESVRLIEDVVFNARFLAGAGEVAVAGGAPYHYVKREGSSLTNANEYGASEYWLLHERRIMELYQLLRGWGAEVSEPARPSLGAAYVRFVISTLERSYHAVEPWDAHRRRVWLAGIARTDLYQELVPYARSESRSLDVAIRAVRGGKVVPTLAIGRVAHLARTHAYGLFTRIRNGR